MGRDLIKNEQKSRILELTIKALDGEILSAESEELEGYISSSRALAEYYSTCIKVHLCMIELKASHCLILGAGNPALDRGFWQMIAIHEETAPKIEISQEEEKKELVRKASYSPREKRKVNKLNIIFLAMNVAAVLFVVLFLKFAPPKVQVATLSDSINAEWVDMDSRIQEGARLVATSDKLMLREGLVELAFDNYTNVVIEGPAEFQILAEDRVGLTYGRIFTHVPSSAIGFSVYTPNAKVIDMGTEFGVEVDFDGTTELHVMQGGTMLISTGRDQKSGISVNEGMGKKISRIGGKVSDIVCEQTKFARKINIGDNKYVWRGENLSLASVIDGRDGFQKVDSLNGINPANGTYTTKVKSLDRISKKAYTLVPDSKFIDGVFVPDGEEGVIPVTSAGHIFTCPDTSGIFTHEVVVYKGDIESQSTTIPPAVFNNKTFDNNPVVMLHSNIGITFDLQAIRQSLPEVGLKGFKAIGGITEALDYLQEDRPDVSFWILLDGQIKYKKQKLKVEDGLISFNVEFSPQDRFLTLVVTDGLRGAEGENRKYPYGNDFFYLIGPELCLTDIRSDR